MRRTMKAMGRAWFFVTNSNCGHKSGCARIADKKKAIPARKLRSTCPKVSFSKSLSTMQLRSFLLLWLAPLLVLHLELRINCVVAGFGAGGGFGSSSGFTTAGGRGGLV